MSVLGAGRVTLCTACVVGTGEIALGLSIPLGRWRLRAAGELREPTVGSWGLPRRGCGRARRARCPTARPLPRSE